MNGGSVASACHRSAAQMRRILPAAASEMGRRGGVARMRMLSLEERRAIGRLGAQRRWHKPEATAPVMVEAPPP
jgi:hypothetical protein